VKSENNVHNILLRVCGYRTCVCLHMHKIAV
jgi:hypothetical protein